MKDKGILRFFPTEPVIADTFTTLTFEYTAGSKELELGGSLEVVLFTRFSTNLWSHPQKEDPTAPGYLSAVIYGSAYPIIDIYRIPPP